MTSINAMNTELNLLRDKADRARAEYRKERDAAKEDRSLSEEYKQARITDARNALEQTLTSLQQQEDNYLDATRRTLERDVYGIKDSANILAYRDAMDRVRALTHEQEADALTLWQQAERSDDTTLKQALHERAASAGWEEVSTAYKRANPAHVDKLDSLDAINRFTTNPEHIIQKAADYQMPWD